MSQYFPDFMHLSLASVSLQIHLAYHILMASEDYDDSWELLIRLIIDNCWQFLIITYDSWSFLMIIDGHLLFLMIIDLMVTYHFWWLLMVTYCFWWLLIWWSLIFSDDNWWCLWLLVKIMDDFLLFLFTTDWNYFKNNTVYQQSLMIFVNYYWW